MIHSESKRVKAVPLEKKTVDTVKTKKHLVVPSVNGVIEATPLGKSKGIYDHRTRKACGNDDVEDLETKELIKQFNLKIDILVKFAS
jgi:hypothetical protein